MAVYDYVALTNALNTEFLDSYEGWETGEPKHGSVVIAKCACKETPYGFFEYIDVYDDEKNKHMFSSFYRLGDCNCDKDRIQYGWDMCNEPDKWIRVS